LRERACSRARDAIAPRAARSHSAFLITQNILFDARSTDVARHEETKIMKSTIYCMAIATSLSLALSACGGGGSGNSASTTGTAAPSSGASATPATGASTTPASGASSPAATAAISLFPAVGPSASSFTPTGDTVNDAMAYVNDKRAQVGLPAFAYQSAVAQAATDHAVYAQANNALGHFEAAGMPDYTGVTPTDRVNALFPTTGAGEIFASSSGPFSSSTEPIELLFDAPFHRSVTLFDFVYAGPGVALSTDFSKLSVFDEDFAGYRAVVPDNQLVAYPYNGQTNTNTSWFANESPNPLAASPQYIGTVVGYPITLSGSNNAAFSNVAFTITDANGINVPCEEIDSSNNTEATRLALCTPFQPLSPSTTYSVKVSGSLTNASIPTPQPFAVNWSFTTAATANVPIGAPLPPTTTTTTATTSTTANQSSTAKAAVARKLTIY